MITDVEEGELSPHHLHVLEVLPDPPEPRPVVPPDTVCVDSTASPDLLVFQHVCQLAARQLTKDVTQPNIQLLLTAVQAARFQRHLRTASVLPTPDTAASTCILFCSIPSGPERPPTGKLCSLSPKLDVMPRFRFCAWISFAGKRCKVLFDTGADYSLVSARLATESGLFIDPDATTPALLTATGEAVGVLGTVCGRMNIGSYRIPRQGLIVMKDMADDLDIILGLNWMGTHGCILDMKSCTMILVGRNVDLMSEYKEGSSKHTVFPKSFFMPPGVSDKQTIQPIRTHAKLMKYLHSGPNARLCMGYVKCINGEWWMRGSQFDPGESTEDAQRLCSLQPAKDPGKDPPLPEPDPTSLPSPPPRVIDSDPALSTLPAAFQKMLFLHWELFEPMKPGVADKFQYPFSAIELSDSAPKFNRMYRLSPAEAAECELQIKNFLSNGWIRESKSPYGAPILFASKPNGGLRLCIDFRMINKVTVRNRYPLPIIQDVLDKLAGSKVFTSLDLIAGYHQIALLEQDIPKTAFRTPFGHYECLVLWEGLTNAPSIFQGIMANVLRPVLGKFAVLYIDDILIYSKTEEEHVDHVNQVLQLLKDASLHVKLAKCKFAQPQLKFLGHLVSQEGTCMDPEKVKAVSAFPRPTETVHIQQFVDLCNYFSRYIQDYARIAAPLTRIQNLKGPWPESHWGPDQTTSFEALKHVITQDVLLKLPDMQAAISGTAPFQVVVDASQEGMGGVLLQSGRPVAFYSHQFSSCERKFGAGDREMCAIIFALKTWRCYLEGVEFDLFTDHEPLTYFESISQLDRRKAGYVEFLSRFAFSWTHIKGNLNVVADCLSRVHTWSESTAPLSSDLSSGLHIINMLQGKICGATRSGKLIGCDDPNVNPKYFPDGYCPKPTGHMHLGNDDKLAEVTDVDMIDRDAEEDVQEPLGDTPESALPLQPPPQPFMVPHPAPAPVPAPVLTPAPEAPTPLVVPMDTSPDSAQQPAMPDRFLNPLVAKILLAYSTDAKFRSRLFTKDLLRTPTGLYLRPISIEDQLLARQSGKMCHKTVIMIPNCASLKKDIMFACHDCPWSGHRGYEGTLDIIQRDFWWEGITVDVKAYVAQCHLCQTVKTDHTKPKGTMISPSIPTRRFGSWSMDMIVSLPRSVGGYDAVLVVVCRLSKYTWFIPCKTTATARKCAQLAFEHVCKFVGLPDEIISDRDSRFATGHFAKALWALYGVSQYTSTAYHPSTDGQTERMNKTLHEYIRSYIGPSHGNWAEHIHMAQFALNNSYSPSIGASPFYFVLGFHPKTPHTHLLHEDADANPDAATFALERNNDLLAAQQCLSRARARMKMHYDHNRVSVRFEVGSEVLLSTRNLRLRGCAKYLPRFVGPFHVLEAIGPRSDASVAPNAYRLELPAGWNIHPVFNVNILKPYARGGPGLKHLHPLPTLLDDYSYVIESIVSHEKDKQSLHGLRFRVHLHNTPDDSDMWEDEATLSAQCPALLESYRQTHSL